MNQTTTQAMTLYFSPLACSVATRIAFYEAGREARFVYVDSKSKQLDDGTDYYQINPLGQVPVLRIGDDMLLTENAAVLQYVAEAFPDAQLLPEGMLERARLRQWLGFIGTELHKAVFYPLLDPDAAPDVKAYAREHVPQRMSVLRQRLAAHEFLLDTFSIADLYLVTVLNWAQTSGMDLAQWPEVKDYYKRIAKRPAVARAFAEEFALYMEQQNRRAAA